MVIDALKLVMLLDPTVRLVSLHFASRINPNPSNNMRTEPPGLPLSADSRTRASHF